MKPISQIELQTFVESYGDYIRGAYLQEVVANDTGVSLGFWCGYRFWLVIDLKNSCPLILVFKSEKSPLIKKTTTKPVGLFIQAHLKGLQVKSIALLEKWGRVVLLEFGGVGQDHELQKTAKLEITLIPHHANLKVIAAGKEIFWNKPKEKTLPPPGVIMPEPRSIEQIHSEWLDQQVVEKKPTTDPEVQWRKKIDKEIQKKKKNLEQLLSMDYEAEAAAWKAKGESLKSLLSSSADNKAQLQNEMNAAFEKAKSFKEKEAGATRRIEVLKEDIEKLELTTFASNQKNEKKVERDLFSDGKSKGRRLQIRDGMTAYLGKNAEDNLSLLRKAKPWDLWMHLRDFPGAHVIISRQRNQNVDIADIQKVAEWLAEQTIATKKIEIFNLSVAYTECRFVKPIKGDRLGRVTYHEAQYVNVKLR